MASKTPTIEVHKPRELQSGAPSETHRAIREIIDYEASRFRIGVVETDKFERASSTDLRPSFIEEAARLKEAVPDLNIPTTVTYEDYRREPFYPVMVKNEKTHLSKHKYLVESSDQFSTFEKWMAQHGDQSDWVFQQFIDCPSDSYSSFRVIADCTGAVYTSQILYGAPKEMEQVHDTGAEKVTAKRPAYMLEDPESEFYLGARVTASNRLFVEHKRARRERPIQVASESSWRRGSDVVDDYDQYRGGSETVDDYDSYSAGSATVNRYQTRRGSDVVDDYYPGNGSSTVVRTSVRTHDDWSDYFNEDGMIGGRLTLDRNPASHPYSEREEVILQDYGLDAEFPSQPSLPSDLRKTASAIARELGMEGDVVKELVLGIDFIRDEKTGKDYLLEVNRRPRIANVQDYFGGVPVIEALAAHRWTLNRAINNIAYQYDLEEQ